MLKIFKSGNAVETSEIVAVRIVYGYEGTLVVSVDTPEITYKAYESSDEEKILKHFYETITELNSNGRKFIALNGEKVLESYFNVFAIRAVDIDADVGVNEENNSTTTFTVYIDVKGSRVGFNYPVGYFYDDLESAKTFVKDIVYKIDVAQEAYRKS